MRFRTKASQRRGGRTIRKYTEIVGVWRDGAGASKHQWFQTMPPSLSVGDDAPFDKLGLIKTEGGLVVLAAQCLARH